ncbi:metallophosphoesterase [Dysosmobacter sp.]|uniref:metallophosphoesterase n=1 Tax=Dysosmobacter sp. TaxID=2591382 RepID=UPI003AF1AEF5
MSDIHGDLDRFQKMLKEIAFSDADVLYVLGDVIDYRRRSRLGRIFSSLRSKGSYSH